MPHRAVARVGLLALALLLVGGASPALAQYEIPPDNPFVSHPGARGEVFVYGMRNPYRWSFDRATGDMWIGDVGGTQEEVTHLSRAQIAGANLGWNCFSGTAIASGCTPTNHVLPVHTYPSSSDVVIGGYVVHDPDLPSFAGDYLFGRFNNGIYRLEANGTATQLLGPPTITSLASFGEDGVGHLYVASLAGQVFRLGETGAALNATPIGTFTQPVAIAAPPGDAERLFIVEKAGVVKVRIGAQVTDFLDIREQVSEVGEQGLLAFAVSPDYATSGRVFAYYTDNNGDLQLDEYTRSADGPDRSDPSTRRPLLTISHRAATNHNGGQLLFGPDGHLYLSTGDGGTQGDPEGDGQSLASLLGKVLRIDVDPAPGPPPMVDTVPPRLRVLVKRKQRVRRLRGAVAYVRCDESCAVIAGGRLRIRKRAYRMRRVGSTVEVGQRVRLKVLLTRKGRRALRKAFMRRRRASVTVNLRARDATGNRSPLTRRTVRVRR
jgi:glucose/arabinose dehydrogenase